MPVGNRIAEFHHPCAQPAAGVVLEQDVVGHHDGGPSSGLQRPHDMLDEGELLVGRVGGYREIRAVWPAATLLGAKGRIGEDEFGFGKPRAVRPSQGLAFAHGTASRVGNGEQIKLKAILRRPRLGPT
jgi:hypothetical protein